MTALIASCYGETPQRLSKRQFKNFFSILFLNLSKSIRSEIEYRSSATLNGKTAIMLFKRKLQQFAKKPY